MTNKQKYKIFCESEQDIPIFSCDWWLDAVCVGGSWDVLLFEKGGNIYASMPYHQKTRLFFQLNTMPQLTQTLGVYIKHPSQKHHKKLSFEKEVIDYFISQMPSSDYFFQNFHHSFTNWLPFFWKGFEQSTRYTYIIKKDTALEELENSFETDVRRRKRKAADCGLEVFEHDDVREFFRINAMTFARQNKSMPYSIGLIKNIYEVCRKNNACKMYFARDKDGVFVAASFLVFDKNTVYYLMGGINPNRKDVGGMEAVLYESIKFALESDRNFDFEGSMIEGIEKYFRSFGAAQTPYFSISKTSSFLLKLRKFIIDIY